MIFTCRTLEPASRALRKEGYKMSRDEIDLPGPGRPKLAAEPESVASRADRFARSPIDWEDVWKKVDDYFAGSSAYRSILFPEHVNIPKSKTRFERVERR